MDLSRIFTTQNEAFLVLLKIQIPTPLLLINQHVCNGFLIIVFLELGKFRNRACLHSRHQIKKYNSLTPLAHAKYKAFTSNIYRTHRNFILFTRDK